jgi:hypothetical protein
MNHALALARLPARAPSSVAARLDAARRAVEGRFLDAGEVLAQAVEGLGRLITSLDKLGETLDAETVAATTGELRDAADGLLALPDRHAERRLAIESLAGAGERLADGIEDMGRNLAYLRVFAINIKITAAGIAAAGKEFGDFAQEICDCIELGRTQLEAFDGELRALRGVFKGALGHEQALAGQCQGLLPAVPDGLTASAAAMNAYHQRIADVAVDVAGLARGVHKKIGQALAALQIGDITRQRIEHVGHILGLLEAADDVTADQRERMAAFVYGLLTDQLRAAAIDFHRDVARIGAAMDGMAGDAAEILRLRDLALGREEASDQGFLRQLESHVAKALTLVDGMAVADTQALAMGASAAAAVAGLGARIAGLRTIKADVQQMALNTTLRCGRIGDTGKPLGVIAVELRMRAGHMETSAQEALSALDGLSVHADRLSGGDAGLASNVGAALSDVNLRLRAAGDAVDAELVSLAQQGEAVVEALSQAAGRLDFRREIGTILDEAADDFAARAGEETPWVDDLAEPLGGLLAQAAKCYTMAQEREVHGRRTAGLAFDAPCAPVAAAPAAADLDDVLF